MDLVSAIRTSAAVAERRAALRVGDPRELALREHQALVDFDAYGRVKQAGLEEMLSLAKRPLAWGVGLGLPALGVGHALISDAHGQAKDLVRDTRNQALLTAAGIGGMQSLGGLLQAAASRPPARARSMDPVDPGMRIAADLRVDDLLEDACRLGKHAALAHLIRHRSLAMREVRELVL